MRSVPKIPRASDFREMAGFSAAVMSYSRDKAELSPAQAPSAGDTVISGHGSLQRDGGLCVPAEVEVMDSKAVVPVAEGGVECCLLAAAACIHEKQI